MTPINTEIQVKNLDHLGLVAGIVDQLVQSSRNNPSAQTASGKPLNFQTKGLAIVRLK